MLIAPCHVPFARAMFTQWPDQPEAQVEIELLGPVGLRANGRRTELGSDKERNLLASLAFEANRPVALETIVERLWEGEPPVHARENTHTYVSRIRRALRHSEPDEAGPQITSRAHTYTLKVAPDQVDLHRYQRLVARAGNSAAAGDDEEAVVVLDRAEALWKGEALAGLPGVWAQSVRGTLGERRIGALVSRTGAALRLGRFAETGVILSSLVAQHPGDETLVGHLVLARYGCGRYTDALRVYQEAQHFLLEQYGSSPSIELQRIQQGVLNRVPAPDLVRGASPVARTAPSKTLRRPPHTPRNLPRQATLIGRESELRTLGAAAETNGAIVSLETVSSVSGMAGVGKTAIAVAGARRLSSRFPDAQLYIDLRGHSPVQDPLSTGAALGALLRLLGIPAKMIPAEVEDRTALWQTVLTQRKAIIVLDDAASAAQVLPLLPESSPSFTIITSRRHLTGLPQARHIPLDVLPTDDAVALFRAFAGTERTRDIREVTRIVRLCGHLPLAIELVASRFHVRPAWTLATLADRLSRSESRLDEIRDADQEVGRAFDLSYRTLPEDQRAAFRRLTLHPGLDFTLESAAATLGLPSARTERLLETLLTCHMLREPVPDRYQYHDLLREYGKSKSRSDDDEKERAAIERRLTDFYLSSADRADRIAYPNRLRNSAPHTDRPAGVNDGQESERAKAWLTVERANLLAMEQSARRRGLLEDAAALAYSIAGFLEAECHWHDARSVLEPAVAHWNRIDDRSALCLGLFHLSASYACIGRYPEAAEKGERALAIARATNNREAEAESLRTLGALNWHLGRNQQALDLFRESFSITETSKNPWKDGQSHNNIAVTMLFIGDHSKALQHFTKAMENFTVTRDHTALGKVLNNIGDLNMRTGDLESARKSFTDSLLCLEKFGNRYDVATAQAGLADCETASGNIEIALPLHLEALSAFRLLGDKKSQAETLIGLGIAYRKRSENEKSIHYLVSAIDVAETIGALHQEIQALCLIGEIHSSNSDFELAIEYFQRAADAAHSARLTDEFAVATGAVADLRRHVTGEHGGPRRAR